MKRFFLTLLASTLGVFIAAGILLFIGIGMLMSIAMSSTKQTVYEPKANTIYKLDLQGSLVEQAQDNPLELLFGNAEKQLGVSDVIKAIRNARMNPNIAGIYLDAGNLSAGFASLESIREELKAFKAVHRRVCRQLHARDILSRQCRRLAFSESARNGRADGPGLAGFVLHGLGG